jgi:hypothetical protein
VHHAGLVAGNWKLTVRAGPRVERARYGTLAEALDALEDRALSLAATTDLKELDVKIRKFAPADQVAARAEVAGPQRLLPKVRAGVDVRGDGSLVAFVGGSRRQEVEPKKGQTPFKALRKALRSELAAYG